MSHNNIHFITGLPRELSNLKSLDISHNNLETVSGLDCLTGLIELNLSHNQIHVVREISKLCLISHLKYLTVTGNPFARVKPYRIVVLSYFKGKELILDKRPITQKETAKLKSYPIKSRASSSPEHVQGDSNLNKEVPFGRSHSFNVFCLPESDDDSGIEGAPSLRSNSVILDPDESEFKDRGLLFNWEYYSGEDRYLSSKIQRLTCQPSEAEQLETGPSNHCDLDAKEIQNFNWHGIEFLQTGNDSIKPASSQVSEETTVKDGMSFPSQDANHSNEQFGYKEELFQNSTKVPHGNDFLFVTGGGKFTD